MLQTTLCYIECCGCYLMLHRTSKKNDVNHDKWIGVGGKFEPGEAPEDCLLREVTEETGFRLTSYRYRGLLTFLYNDKEPEYIFTYTADGFIPAEGDAKHAASADSDSTGQNGDSISYDGKTALLPPLPACREGVLEWVPKEKVLSLPIWEGDRFLFELLFAEQTRPFSLKLRYQDDTLLEAFELSGGVRVLKQL